MIVRPRIEDVRRIEVAVQDAVLVRPAERGEGAAQDPDEVARRQPGLAAAAAAIADLGEVEPVEVIEDGAEPAVAGAELIARRREVDRRLAAGSRRIRPRTRASCCSRSLSLVWSAILSATWRRSPRTWPP